MRDEVTGAIASFQKFSADKEVRMQILIEEKTKLKVHCEGLMVGAVAGAGSTTTTTTTTRSSSRRRRSSWSSRRPDRGAWRWGAGEGERQVPAICDIDIGYRMHIVDRQQQIKGPPTKAGARCPRPRPRPPWSVVGGGGG
jgi:hypothetical protein